MAVPLASVELGCVRLAPFAGVAVSATAASPIGLSKASVTVTVMVEVWSPTTIDVGEALTVECDAETRPGVTITAACWLIAAPFAVAETVLVSATVEVSVAVKTPVSSVVPVGSVRVFPLPEATRSTVAPLTGLSSTSLAVTVIVEPVPPAAIDVGAALTVECDASTNPAPEAAALISTPSAPAFRLRGQVASIVLSLAFHSAWRSAGGISPDGCSAISAKPAPGVTVATLRRTPKTP